MQAFTIPHPLLCDPSVFFYYHFHRITQWTCSVLILSCVSSYVRHNTLLVTLDPEDLQTDGVVIHSFSAAYCGRKAGTPWTGHPRVTYLLFSF